VKTLIADDDAVTRRLIERILQLPHLRKFRRLIIVAASVVCLFSAWTLNAQSQSDPDAMSLSFEELTHAKVFSAS
jgi:hypothetical protein